MNMNHNEKLQQHFHCFHDRSVPRIVSWVFIGIIVAAIFALIFGLAVKALWNWLMPAVFGLGVISYWQAFGIIILAKILFSGMGPYHGHHGRGPSFIRQRRFYDHWWREEGKSAFDNWLKSQAGANSPDTDAQK